MFAHDGFIIVLTALNLTNFAEDGPLPSDHIPKNRKFVASQLSPFATNMQVQGKLASTDHFVIPRLTGSFVHLRS